jgi:HSP20 family protein
MAPTAPLIFLGGARSALSAPPERRRSIHYVFVNEVIVMAEQQTDQSKSQAKKSGNGSQRGAMTRPEPRSMTGTGFAPLGRLRSEFDRLFDDFFQGWPSLGRASDEHRWELDFQDQADAVVVHADAPGFEPGDFNLEIRGDNLILCACQSEEQSKEDSGYRWERREFYRSIPLPAEINEDKVDAQYRNGVLTIKLPKREPAKTRKIEVKS